MDFGIAYDDQKKDIYVFGGYSGDRLKHCEKYSCSNNKWLEIAPMGKTKMCTSACIMNNQFIFIIGGYDGGYLSDIEKYTIALNSMETI